MMIFFVEASAAPLPRVDGGAARFAPNARFHLAPDREVRGADTGFFVPDTLPEQLFLCNLSTFGVNHITLLCLIRSRPGANPAAG